MLSDDLRRRVLEDLEKSGFTSEIRALTAVREAGMIGTGSFSYVDRDENVARQIDLLAVSALFDVSLKSTTVKSEAYLIGEVKRTEAPWVVFRERRTLSEGVFFRPGIITYNDLPFDPEAVRLIFNEKMLVRKHDWVGYGIHESFKKPSDRSRWYSALVTVSKAAEAMFHSDDPPEPEPGEEAKTKIPCSSFAYAQPVVILDGELLCADLDGNGELCLAEVPAAPMRLYFKTANYTREWYDVDIVTLKAWPAYLRAARRAIRAVHIGLLSKFRDLDEEWLRERKRQEQDSSAADGIELL